MASRNPPLEDTDYDRFFTAIHTGDREGIRTGINSGVTLDSTQTSYCDMPECECVTVTSVSKYIGQGGCSPETLSFLLELRYISPQAAVPILYHLFKMSGTTVYDTQDYHVCDRCADVLLAYLEPHKELLRAYRDPEYNTSLLHCAMYGHSLDATQMRWVDKLLYWGLDPLTETTEGQTPFELMVKNLYVEQIHRILRTRQVDINRFELYDGWCNRAPLMQVLRDYSHTKNADTIRRVVETVRTIVDAGYNTNYVDSNNWNLTNYIEHYQWTAFIDVHELHLPASSESMKQPKPRPIYKQHNTTPYGEFLHRYKYAKVITPAMEDEARAIIETHGYPSEEQMYGHLPYINLAYSARLYGFVGTSICEIFRITNV
jgi:hypothetical protein